MATHPDYPGASSRIKNGKEVWRYRANRSAQQINLPGLPGEPPFHIAYTNALQGSVAVTPKRKADTVAMPGAALPQTMGAAMRLLLASSEWAEKGRETQVNKERYLKQFLDRRISDGSTATWRDAKAAGIDFHRIDALIAEIKRAKGNNVAKRWLEVINDLLLQALRAKWIGALPTYGLKVTPKQSDGHKEWPREYREKFEAYHAIGSAARTAYVLGYWFGDRRGDVASVGWQHIIEEEVETVDGDWRNVRAFNFRQSKNRELNGGVEVYHPILPWVDEALAPLSRDTETILTTGYGKPFSEKALTMRFQVWTRQAGIPPGYTPHGLRKSLGNHLAELGLSQRQIMQVLGHSKLSSSDPYVKKADKKRLSIDAYDEIERRERRRQLRVVK
ncbi:tyrosine-type recombinase/integrase [Mesorhizobium sp.]|uniref:tyrosine-type recombinase/integrase n=1 Tax=Mesorhizobium sp. TaxID=1871066 RepID=UPI000FE33667|nr:tyrosine-type recombinase/integrase [Mesorhizobium sp.]RWN98196.1 MAG: integrase [Mesorhizobium sp.]